MNVTDLPAEVLSCVFSFLSDRKCRDSVALTCKKFMKVLRSDPKKYSRLQLTQVFFTPHSTDNDWKIIQGVLDNFSALQELNIITGDLDKSPEHVENFCKPTYSLVPKLRQVTFMPFHLEWRENEKSKDFFNVTHLTFSPEDIKLENLNYNNSKAIQGVEINFKEKQEIDLQKLFGLVPHLKILSVSNSKLFFKRTKAEECQRILIQIIQHYEQSLEQINLKAGNQDMLKAALNCPTIKSIEISFKNCIRHNDPGIDFEAFVHCPGWKSLTHFILDQARILALPLEKLPAPNLKRLGLYHPHRIAPELLKAIPLHWTSLKAVHFDLLEHLPNEDLLQVLGAFNDNAKVRKIYYGTVEFQHLHEIEALQKLLLLRNWNDSAEIELNVELSPGLDDEEEEDEFRGCWQIKNGCILQHEGSCPVVFSRMTERLPSRIGSRWTEHKWQHCFYLEQELAGPGIVKKRKLDMPKLENKAKKSKQDEDCLPVSFSGYKDDVLEEIKALQDKIGAYHSKISGSESFHFLDFDKLQTEMKDSMENLSRLYQNIKNRQKEESMEY